MGILLYEKPEMIELNDYELFVNHKKHDRSIRTLAQMSEVLLEAVGPENQYYMYRKVYAHQHLRFDVTVIPQSSEGLEYPKTFGHYHPKSSDGPEYPEVYQVLKGKATFILQKRLENGSFDVFIVDASEKDVVLLPPGFGHVSVNSGKSDLVLSNIVYDLFESNYEDYRKHKGAAFYYLRNGEVVQNKNYSINLMERLSSKRLSDHYNFSSSDLLRELEADSKKFEFLHKPRLLFKE